MTQCLQPKMSFSFFTVEFSVKTAGFHISCSYWGRLGPSRSRFTVLTVDLEVFFTSEGQAKREMDRWIDQVSAGVALAQLWS